MQFRLILIVLGVVLWAPGGVRAASLADVLESMIEAYGGEENVRKLDSMVQEWDLLPSSTTVNRHRRATCREVRCGCSSCAFIHR
jgi:hypothetical protein